MIDMAYIHRHREPEFGSKHVGWLLGFVPFYMLEIAHYIFKHGFQLVLFESHALQLGSHSLSVTSLEHWVPTYFGIQIVHELMESGPEV